MEQTIPFGKIVREKRASLGFTQATLAKQVSCAEITIRRIEGGSLRPSVQLAKLLAQALEISDEKLYSFIQLARNEKSPTPLPNPPPLPTEIGNDDLTGRAIKGYQLTEKIGSGEYGIVYRAEQPLVKREVAIKIIQPSYANQPAFIRNFESEAYLIARAEHPHIVPLYDYWREPNAAYLIMRLLRGGDLEKYLQLGPIPIKLFQTMAMQIGQAIAFGHSQGFIHRDIKPANILLDDTKNGYLADLGIAKLIDHQLNKGPTVEASAIGSPAYISPEQIQMGPIGPFTDIYSFGLLLYEMLSGKKAFTGPTPVSYFEQHINKPTPLLRASHPEIPVALDDLIQKATAKQPIERFQSLNTLLENLNTIWNKPKVVIVESKNIDHQLSLEQIEVLKNPFLGLRAFSEADAPNFFGRETYIENLLQKLSDESDLERFLSVIGPSGSGKSSVVKAGLLPAIRRGLLPNSDKWFIIAITPTAYPWKELELGLMQIAVNTPESLMVQLEANSRGLLDTVKQILPEDENVELLIVIDQFEELFTLVQNEAVRVAFLESLITATLDPQTRVRIVITMRADFMDRPLQYTDFGELIRQRLTLITPLSSDEMARAISNPIENLGLAIEPNLIATIVQDVGDQPGMLPMLQYALTELFEARKGPLFTLDDYLALGGVTGSLAQRADDLYYSLDPAGRDAAKQLFLRLITLGEGVEETRRRVRLSEIESLTSVVKGKETSFLAVLVADLFGDNRFLTFDHDPFSRERTIEVAHEALIREWPLLRKWLRASREDIRLHQELSSTVSLWKANLLDESYFLRGERLSRYENWQKETDLILNEQETQFLSRSIQERDARHLADFERTERELETVQQLVHAEKERADIEAMRAQENSSNLRRSRRFAVGLLFFLIVAIGTAWFANNQSQVAQTNLLTSERIRLASQAQSAFEQGEGGELVSLLALHSLNLGYSPEADLSFQSAFEAGLPLLEFVGHNGKIWGVQFSADGRYIFSAGSDTTVRMWDAVTNEEVQRFEGHSGEVYQVKISPDGTRLATVSPDDSLRLWDIDSGNEIRIITDQLEGAWSIDFMPNGEAIMTAEAAGFARLWDIDSGSVLQTYADHEGEVTFLDISPDGETMVTVGTDGIPRLWDIVSGAIFHKLVGHEGWVGSTDFSPDGKYVLTTGQDGTARIWDVETGRELRLFAGHASEIFDGKYSPDGRYVATSGNDKTARIWDVQTGLEINQFRGHTEPLSEIDFSPDNKLLVTGSEDGSLLLWDIWEKSEPKAYGPFGYVHSMSQSVISISPDRRFAIVGRSSGLVEIWDNETNGIIQRFEKPGQAITASSFSHDSKKAVVATNEGSLTLWDIVADQAVHSFSAHSGFVSSLLFSKNDKKILSGGADGTLRLWDIQTGSAISTLRSSHGSIHTFDFSPDESHIIAAGEMGVIEEWSLENGVITSRIDLGLGAILSIIYVDDETIVIGLENNIAYLWDLNRDRELRQFVGHVDGVTQLAVSPDGKSLLTGSRDQTTRIWDIDSGAQIRQFGNHTSGVMQVEFSPDGKTVLSGGNGFAYESMASLDDLVERACTQLRSELTASEIVLYNVENSNPCREYNAGILTELPTRTPIAETPIPQDAVKAEVNLEFMLLDEGLIAFGFPTQHLYHELTGDEDMVMRIPDLEPGTLTKPLFSTAEYVPDDYVDPPFDVGPYQKGKALGFTLEDWLAATGEGVYIQTGNTAFVDLTFDNLVPNSFYTLWCMKILLPTFEIASELPCGALDGSENRFETDNNGYGEIELDIDAFPPGTDEAVYELAIAYHSDGQTHGAKVGQRSKNVHIHMIFDFYPPER